MDWSKLRKALEPKIQKREESNREEPDRKEPEREESDSEPTKSKVFESYNTAESVWGDLEDDDGEKKKKPKQNRTVEKDKLEVTKECGECGKRIKNVKKALLCKCKVVLYCTHSCLASSDHFGNCQERMKPVELSLDALKETFEGPLLSALTSQIQEKMGSLKITHPGDVRRLAEEGNPIAAYMIGSSYSTRIATAEKALSSLMSKKDLKKSVGETDEEAIKWFLIAAKGGMADGMESLACKLWADNGLKTDRRVAFYWMAKAWETGEVGEVCWQMLEEEGLLAKEIRSSLVSMQQSGASLSGQALHMGPNLGNLLLASRYNNLRKWGKSTPLGTPLFGSSWLSTLFDLIDSYRINPRFASGRVGTGKESTKMCIPKERSMANIRFCQGQRDLSCMDLEQVNLCDEGSEPAKQRSEYWVLCIHLNQGFPLLAGRCQDCREDARQRSISVAA